jgi:hypothetical protein
MSDSIQDPPAHRISFSATLMFFVSYKQRGYRPIALTIPRQAEPSIHSHILAAVAPGLSLYSDGIATLCRLRFFLMLSIN